MKYTALKVPPCSLYQGASPARALTPPTDHEGLALGQYDRQRKVYDEQRRRDYNALLQQVYLGRLTDIMGFNVQAMLGEVKLRRRCLVKCVPLRAEYFVCLISFGLITQLVPTGNSG